MRLSKLSWKKKWHNDLQGCQHTVPWTSGCNATLHNMDMRRKKCAECLRLCATHHFISFS